GPRAPPASARDRRRTAGTSTGCASPRASPGRDPRPPGPGARGSSARRRPARRRSGGRRPRCGGASTRRAARRRAPVRPAARRARARSPAAATTAHVRDASRSGLSPGPGSARAGAAVVTPVTPRDTGPRIGCLLVEDLPVAAQLRAEPELAGVPFAVVSEAGPRAVVLGVSPEAARAGIPRRGATLSHARSVCAELRVRLASPAGGGAGRGALRDVALWVAPRVALAPRRAGELAGEALVHLDASGQSARFASEEGLAGALVARAHALGLPAVAA